MSSPTKAVIGAIVLSLGCVSIANAAFISRLGGQAMYDTDLDITWLTNANLAATNTFGVSGIGANGTMKWDTAHNWIAAMNADGGTGYLGINNWRMPTLKPNDGSGIPTSSNMIGSFSTNASTSLGYARTTTNGTDGGWRDPAGNPVSEMGHLYYVDLANKGLCIPNDVDPTTCTERPMSEVGLLNGGPFINVQADLAVQTHYWTGTQFEHFHLDAWFFRFELGQQEQFSKASPSFVWAVRSGDVLTPVPVPAAVWLFGSGLIGLLGAVRRRC